ncbi:hypothetical protein ACFQ2B_23005 [Streptomyces stramineus]
MAEGLRPQLTDPRTKALLTGELKRSVTYTRVSESAVKVPAKGAGGQAVFLNRLEAVTAVKGA